MKRTLLTLSLLLGVSLGRSAPIPNWNDVIRISNSVTAQTPAVMFSSAPISIVAITVSSPIANGRLVMYRSTSSAFTLDVASEIIVHAGYNVNYVGGNQTIPLFDVKHPSYTYIEKLGASETTIWFRCIGGTNVGVCPGIPYTGQR